MIRADVKADDHMIAKANPANIERMSMSLKCPASSEAVLSQFVDQHKKPLSLVCALGKKRGRPKATPFSSSKSWISR